MSHNIYTEHMDLTRERLSGNYTTKLYVNMKYPAIIVEGFTLTCVLNNLMNEKYLTNTRWYEDKVHMYVGMGEDTAYLREIDYSLANIRRIEILSPNIKIEYRKDKENQTEITSLTLLDKVPWDLKREDTLSSTLSNGEGVEL